MCCAVCAILCGHFNRFIIFVFLFRFSVFCFFFFVIFQINAQNVSNIIVVFYGDKRQYNISNFYNYMHNKQNQFRLLIFYGNFFFSFWPNQMLDGKKCLFL